MKRQTPLVTISIPTLNSERTLRRTLDSIKNQTYKNYEVIVIDNGSKDNTLKIAGEYTNRIFHNKGKLLGSRFIGVQKGKGEVHVLIDSDQVLSKDAIERGVTKLFEENLDMLFMEEESYKPETIIEKLTSLDRKITHKKKIIDPSLSVLLPRIFRTEILRKAFSKIDTRLFDVVTLQDHAIIYYESYKISKKIGYLPKAVYHDEPKTLRELFSHYFSWGVKVAERANDMPEEYREMFAKKINNRTRSIELLSYNLVLVSPILATKAAGYYLGLAYNRIK